MLYRNNNSVISTQGVEIDETSLWKLNTEQNFLVLENEDEYHTHPFNRELFTKQ